MKLLVSISHSSLESYPLTVKLRRLKVDVIQLLLRTPAPKIKEAKGQRRPHIQSTRPKLNTMATMEQCVKPGSCSPLLCRDLSSVQVKCIHSCIKHEFVKHKAVAPTAHRKMLKCCHITGRQQDYLNSHLYTLARVCETWQSVHLQ